MDETFAACFWFRRTLFCESASGRDQTVYLVKSSVKMAEASGSNMVKHGLSIHLHLGAHGFIDKVYEVTTPQ